MQALILSKFNRDKLINFLSGGKLTDIARQQRIQNRAARIVFQVPRCHPSSELLDSLHWLPVEIRIIFKILMHIYKLLNDLSPKYLVDCLRSMWLVNELTQVQFLLNSQQSVQATLSLRTYPPLGFGQINSNSLNRVSFIKSLNRQ